MVAFLIVEYFFDSPIDIQVILYLNRKMMKSREALEELSIFGQNYNEL